MKHNSTALLILAAGEGKRMKSSLPKCLHKVGGFPLIDHLLLQTGRKVEQVITVTDQADGPLANHAVTSHSNVKIVEQKQRGGTGHAVQMAMPAVRPEIEYVLIVFGDTPLIADQSVAEAMDKLSSGKDLVVFAFESDKPHGFGRVVTKGSELLRIVEQRDASEDEQKITLCNSGLMAVRRDFLEAFLPKLKNDNDQDEYYLTDLVSLAVQAEKKATLQLIDEQEALGVNTRADLARVEACFQKARREAVMANGVTLHDPASTYFSLDTVLGTDSTIEPHVFFGPRVTLGNKSMVHAFSHLEGVTAGEGSIIGPFARLRPGTAMADRVKIGNFVETKAVSLSNGVKVNHLSYVGDGAVGAGANLGAGTIFCNYDGFNKAKTVIGTGAFVGSNSALVAPVEIGEGAYIGSGSVITEDVPANTLAIGRARQVNLVGRAPKPRKK